MNLPTWIRPRGTRTRVAALALALTAGLTLAGCGGSSGDNGSTGGSSSGSGSSGSSASGGGKVSVLYAGSLVDLMEKKLGPAFAQESGDDYSGYGAGSSEVANEIKGKTRQGDVFISASPSANDTLTGQGNGSWVSWYATFATAPLVIAYNPKSSFAARLKSKPWYDVVTESGFKLGRTDPKLDPKGELTAQAVTEVAKDQKDAGLARSIESHSTVFPEEELVGRLQSGQLDAGFFYSIETKPLGLPTVSIAPVKLAATYTVTVLNRAPNASGGAAFAKYLLGPSGEAMLRKAGFTLVDPPTVTGSSSAVPADLRSMLSGS